MPRWLNAASEIDAAPVFLPIAIPHRIKSAAAAYFLLLLGRLGKRLLLGGQRGFSFRLGSGGCLAYHCRSRNAQILVLSHVSDNLAPTFSGFRALSQAQVVRLSGPDAVPFAQAQFANDVPSLADGHWQWSAWLSAKGRVLAIFQLLRVDAQTLLLVCHDGGAEAMVEQLRRFVFRRKVVISHAETLHVSAALQAPLSARGTALAMQADGVIEVDVGGPTLPRTLHIGAEAMAASSDEELAWRQSDLRLGLPRLEESQREQWTPQQLGLDRLSAYSVKKGCYPGQEIVARTHFLGKAKRSVALLECVAQVKAGDAVLHADSTIGSLASAAGSLAMAVLPLELPEGELRINDAIARIEPLLDGLAR